MLKTMETVRSVSLAITIICFVGIILLLIAKQFIDREPIRTTTLCDY